MGALFVGCSSVASSVAATSVSRLRRPISGLAYLRADDLALFGQADLALHRAWRLRQDGLVAGPAAAADGAAAAVEQAQGQAVFALQRLEQLDQRVLGAVQLPVAGEEAAVLVAVAVAEHDVLLGAAAHDHRQHARLLVELAHDARRIAQVLDGFEQRHDDQVVVGCIVQRAAHQPALLLQQQHLEQVAGVLGVADDVVAQRLGAVALAHLDGGLEDRQFAACQRGVFGATHAQRPGVVEQLDEQRAALHLVQRAVVGLDARHLQQLGQHRFMLVGALAQVHRGQVEAEDLHRAHQRRQARADQRLRMVRLQRTLDHAQVGQELGRARVGVLRRHRMAQRLGAGQRLQRGRQARVHADQRAPVGLVAAVLVVVGRGRGQRQHLGAHRRQHVRGRQLGTQLVHLGQVEAQCGLGLARQRHAQRLGADVGVAVTVAADPVAHAQEGRHLVAGQGLLDLAVQLGDLPQKRGVVVAQRVLDLVGHRQLGGAQHARLPQLGDARADQLLVLAALALAGQIVALANEFGDGAFGIEDALALHLGGVGREHRRDVGALQRGGNVGRAVVGAVQPLEADRQRAFLLVAGALVLQATAHMVPVLGDVGQVREVAEGPDHTHRLVGRQVLQQPVEHPPGAGILLQPVGHRQFAHALDQLEGVLAFLLADDLAEDPAQ